MRSLRVRLCFVLVLVSCRAVPVIELVPHDNEARAVVSRLAPHLAEAFGCDAPQKAVALRYAPDTVPVAWFDGRNETIWFKHAGRIWMNAGKSVFLDDVESEAITMIHELGHAMGLGHIPGSIMAEDNYADNTLTIESAMRSLRKELDEADLDPCN